MYFLLFYKYVEDMAEARTPYRDGHLAHIQGYVDRQELQLAGVYADPFDGAALLFKVDSKLQVEDFAKNDPYVLNNLVTEWAVREWNIAFGSKINFLL